MNVLVPWATGFLGNHLIDACIQNGGSVHFNPYPAGQYKSFIVISWENRGLIFHSALSFHWV